MNIHNMIKLVIIGLVGEITELMLQLSNYVPYLQDNVVTLCIFDCLLHILLYCWSVHHPPPPNGLACPISLPKFLRRTLKIMVTCYTQSCTSASYTSAPIRLHLFCIAVIIIASHQTPSSHGLGMRNKNKSKNKTKYNG